MKNNLYLVTLLCFLILNFCLVAQTENSEKVQQDKIGFKISANYNSGLNYYGRTDSLKSTGVFPLAEFWVGEKFYINAAPVFINNSLASFQYAGTIATAGYLIKPNDSWLGNIYVLKPFYKDNSELVQSALKAQTGVSISWLSKYVNLTGGADIKFSDKTDYGVTGGIDHIFRKQFENNSVLVIDPSAYIYAGTQQFSSSYLKKTNGFFLFPGNEELISTTSQQFNVLSYEISVPVIYALGKFQLLFTPAYVLPKNLITVEGRPDLSERGENMFYATACVKVGF